MNQAPDIFTRLDALPAGARIASIGTFDGVHRGHRHLLDLLVERARALGVESVVVTFEPTPMQLFAPDRFRGRLTSNEERARLLAAAGVDRVVVLPFTQELARQSPQEFIGHLVAAGVGELWVGEDFALGHKRAGDVATLRQIGAGTGMTVNAIARVDFDGMAVSSSAIRERVLAGDVGEANRLLGHPFAMAGRVVHGDQVGRTIGYPTANVPLPRDLVKPADGSYASWAWIEGEASPRAAMTYIGTRPVLNTGERVVETHIFDYDGDLYGKQLRSEFMAFLRPDQHFDGLEPLLEHLADDARRARAVLGTEGTSRIASQAGTTAATTTEPQSPFRV
ncbi:MAG: bifunctional riboflavin kinase/FAD synthetase [Thermomicrobiales bacterium]